MLQNFQFKIVHHIGSRHLNVDVLNHNPMSISKEDEDFGCDELEHKDKLGNTSTWLKDNEIVINMFILQHIHEEAINDAKEQVEDGQERQIEDSMSKKKLHPMIHDDNRIMIVEAHIMVDNAKDQ